MLPNRSPSRLLPALLLVALALAGCSDPEPPLTKQRVFPIKLMTLAADRGGLLQRYPARVEASERSNLAFRVAGELRELEVQPGQRVEAGQLIARLDDRDANSQLSDARSSFDLAQATYQRMEYSVERGAISRARFDEAKAAFLSAKAQYEQARDRLGYTELKAPYAGVIAQVPVDNFQVVGAQETIAVLQKPGQIDVGFSLPEQQVRRISREQAEASRTSEEPVAWVRFGADETRYPARYKEHDTSTREGSLSYEVALTLPEPEGITVLSGMSATVLLDIHRLTGGGADQWRVPVSAVVTRDDAPDQAVVWRYVAPAEGDDTGRVEAVPVEAGAVTDGGMLVAGELAAGDRLVAAGAHRMNAERRVTPWIKEEGL